MSEQRLEPRLKGLKGLPGNNDALCASPCLPMAIGSVSVVQKNRNINK